MCGLLCVICPNLKVSLTFGVCGGNTEQRHVVPQHYSTNSADISVTGKIMSAHMFDNFENGIKM